VPFTKLLWPTVNMLLLINIIKGSPDAMIFFVEMNESRNDEDKTKQK